MNASGQRLLRAIAAVLSVLLLATGAAAGQGDDTPRFTVRVDPPAGEVGQLMTLLVGVEGTVGADCNLIETPAVEGGRLAFAQGPNTQQSSVYVNGRLSKSIRTEWAFQLVPERAGTLSIPPLRFNCRGAEVVTASVSVLVTPSTLAQGVLTLELHPGADTLWAGQAFQIDVVASIDEKRSEQVLRNSYELDLPWLDGVPGLLRLDVPPPSGQLATVRLAGRRDMLEMRPSRDATGTRIVLRRTIDMLATAAGQIELPVSRFSATLAIETARDRGGLSLFGNALEVTKAAVVDARAAGVVIDVRAPPLDGRPKSFTDAVGRFRFTGTAAPTTLRVGDTCMLTLTLTGDGNLDFMTWPAFDELSRDFRVFGKNERKLPRTRVLEIQVSPKTVRVTEVPALEVSAFDPEQGRYETLSAGPFPLSVSPGGEDGLTLESRSETLSNLETIRDALPEPAGSHLPGWALWVPALLVLLVVEVRARRQAWRAGNPALLRRKAARATLDAALAEAEDAFAVCTAFGHFLSARLDGPPAGLTAVEASHRLDDGALGDALRRAYASWEASAMGGARFDLAAARRDAAQLADRVEAAT